MKRHQVVLVCLVVLTVSRSAWAQAKLEYIDVHKPLPSTALVLTRDGWGSGFLVDRGDGILLTNYHVVGETRTVEVVFPVIENLQAIVSRDYYLKKAARLRGAVLSYDPTLDLAAVQVSVPFGVPEIPLARTPPRAGDRASMVGNPISATRAWVWAPGEVKEVAVTRFDYSSGQRVQAKVLHVQADPKFGQGTSGGPAVNTAGELIGVMAAQKSSEPDRKLYIEVSAVRVFLGKNYRSMGTAAIGRRDYPRAIALCSKAVAANTDDPLSYNERGVAYSFQNRNDDAIADYDQALQLNPKLSRVWRNRGSAHYYKGDYAQAVQDCSEAIRLDPKYALAYLTRSKAYQRLDQAMLAQADYERAVQLDASLRQ